MVSPFLFFANERLSMAELTAACLDGCLVALGEGYVPADAVETPWMRARSLAPLLGTRWAAVRTSAAWVHGQLPLEPTCHHAQRVGPARRGIRPTARAHFHDVRLAVSDVVAIAGVHVSTPERTLADLARSAEAADVEIATAWAREEPGTAGAALAWLDAHPRFPFGRRAGIILRAATTR